MMYRLLVLCSVVLVAACSSDGEERPEYLDSYSVKGLEVPPRLTSPDTSQEMNLPEPSEDALRKLQEREDASVKGSVAPMFKGLQLKTDQGLFWLEADGDPDALWPVLTDFWAHEGIKLEREQPLLGFMETEWVKEFEPGNDDSFIVRTLRKLSPDRMDKFRLRIERVADSQKSRIFIGHRGLEVFVNNDGGSSWRQRDSDPELEYEMLHRLALYAGLTSLQADDLFTGYRPYQSRIRALEGEDRFEVAGTMDYVWRRVLLALDRIGVEITTQDKQQGLIEVVVSNVPEKLVTRDSDNELNESSWLVRLFTGGPGDEELEEGQVTIRLALEPDGHATRLQLTHAGEALPNIGLAPRFEEALVELLK